MHRFRRIACVAAVAAGVFAAAPAAEGGQILPVRGGVIDVPDFDPALYHDADRCQLDLNAALNALSDQLGRIPFPPPGEPGYHEWANAIGDQMSRLNAMRPACLALGPPGRTATFTQARAFALRAPAIADRLDALPVLIRTARTPARRRALGNLALSIANGVASRFDLEALRQPATSRLLRNAGARIGGGRVVALPGFANRIQDVADYDAELVGITEARAKADPELAARMDLLANANHGRPYVQLTLDERRAIASQLQTQSGALQILLTRARKLGTAAVNVIFGR